MAATGINHVSVVTRDLDESERFYNEIFEAERIASPNFGIPVRWLRIGFVQLHLVRAPASGDTGLAHFGVTVDDLAPVYETARALDALDPAVNAHHLWELPDGTIQLYLRDPSGNLVEVNAPDASTLSDEMREDVRVLRDLLPQSHDNLRARLLTH